MLSRKFAFSLLLLLAVDAAYAQSTILPPGVPGSAPAKAGPVTSKAPPIDYLVGTWSPVTFNDESDVGRMIQVARGYCNLPYKINRKNPETVEMYVAEKLAEVKFLEQDNRVYVVPLTPEGQRIYGAREFTMRDQNVFTLRYLENANHVRYGLNVFVRCGKQAS